MKLYNNHSFPVTSMKSNSYFSENFLLERCQDPGNPANGWRLGVNYSHGGVVQYRCKNKTYDLVGASRITCDEGVWSPPMPSCEGQYVTVPN